MTGLYSRFEVRYRERSKPTLTHVWGWADDRKALDRLMGGLAANPHLKHAGTVDHHQRRAQVVDSTNPARQSLLL